MQQEQHSLRSIIHAATLAPSGHNTQPWHFDVDGQFVRVRPDFSRRLPIVDPDDRALYISLGCAVENLIIAAREHGLRCSTTYEINGTENSSILIKLEPGSDTRDELFSAIQNRRTNRNLYDGRPLPADQLKQLASMEFGPGVGVNVVTDESDRKAIEDLIVEGDRFQFANLEFKKELARWIRFNKREREQHRDGLTVESTNNPSVPRWLGSLALRLTPPRKQAEKDAKLLASSSALAVIWSNDDSIKSWILSGRAFERFALTTTRLGIQHAHMNQAVEVSYTRKALRSHSTLQNKWPQLILRLGYAKTAPESDRRPIDEVLSIH